MMGVEHDYFWTLTPKSLQPFVKAFELKQEYDDTLAWTNGLYVTMAIASSFDKDSKYPDKPLSSNSKVDDNELNEIKVSRMKETMLERMEIINNRFSKEEIKEVIVNE